MSNIPYIYSSKKLKILNIFILFITFFNLILFVFKTNNADTTLISKSLYTAVLINIVSIILYITVKFRMKFKNIDLLGSIFQLISSIILIFNIENNLLQILVYFMLFSSFIIAILFREEEIDKLKPIENSEIKDDVEKWIQDCYICRIVSNAEKKDYNKIAGREKNYNSIEECRADLANLWELYSKQDILECVTEDCLNNFLHSHKNNLKEKGFNNRKELLNRIEYLKSKSEENLSEEELEKINNEKASLISLDGYFALIVCNKLEILGLAYIADYLTRKEFRECSIRVCKLIQREFYNWDDLVKNYIIGNIEWSERLGYFTDKTSNYIMLKEEKLAYQVDWNLKLE